MMIPRKLTVYLVREIELDKLRLRMNGMIKLLMETPNLDESFRRKMAAQIADVQDWITGLLEEVEDE